MNENNTPRFEIQAETNKQLARRTAYILWREMKTARIVISVCAVVMFLSSVLMAWYGELSHYATLAFVYLSYTFFFDRFTASTLRRTWKKKSGGTIRYAFWELGFRVKDELTSSDVSYPAVEKLRLHGDLLAIYHSKRDAWPVPLEGMSEAAKASFCSFMELQSGQSIKIIRGKPMKLWLRILLLLLCFALLIAAYVVPSWQQVQTLEDTTTYSVPGYSIELPADMTETEDSENLIDLYNDYIVVWAYTADDEYFGTDNAKDAAAALGEYYADERGILQQGELTNGSWVSYYNDGCYYLNVVSELENKQYVVTEFGCFEEDEDLCTARFLRWAESIRCD